MRLLDPLSRHAPPARASCSACCRGGHCFGRAIGVAAEREAEVTAYLDARELLDVYVYERVRLPLRSVGPGRRGRGLVLRRPPEHEHLPAAST